MPIDPQQVFEASLPGIAWLVSYLIQQMRWKDLTNANVAGGTVILAAFASLLIEHKITGNILYDLIGVVGGSIAFQAKALSPLSQWLKAVGSQPTARSSSWQPSRKETNAVSPQRTQYGIDLREQRDEE